MRLGLAAAGALVLPVGSLVLPAEARGEAGDEVVPDFRLPDLRTGEETQLAALLDRPVWLSFWTTWCGPCRAEMPELSKVHRRWEKKGLVVLGVSLDRSIPGAKAFLKRERVTIPSVIDTRGLTVIPFGADQLPTNLFIDPGGQLRERLVGFHPGLFERAEAWLEEVIG
jgi:thiol-disulfide isomerase/thioredoxin